MKKLISTLLASAMLLGLVAACGTDTTQKSTEATPTTTTEDKKMTDEKVELNFWAFPTFGSADMDPIAYTQSMVDAFQASHPNIKVNLEMIDYASGAEKIKTSLEAGTAPDILLDAPGRLIEYGLAGKMVDLASLFTDEYVADIGNEALLSALKGNGTYYVAPIGATPFTMAFNKEAIEKSGAVEFMNLEGDRTWTTENFLKALDKLHEAGYEGASMYCKSQGGDQGMRAFVNNLYNGSMTDKEMTKFTVNDEAGVKALTLIKQLVDDGKLLNGSANDGGADLDLFTNANTAFTTLWSATLASQRAPQMEQTKMEAVIVPFPSENGTPALEFYLAGFGVFDNKDQAKAEAAKEFVKFATQDKEWAVKNAKAANIFPAMQSFGNIYEGNELMSYVQNLTKYYAPYFQTMPTYARMRTFWFPMLQAVLNGQETPQDALDHFVEQANAAQ